MNISLLGRAIGVLMVSMLSSRAFSTVFYTAVTGNDANSCIQARSSLSPRRTISAGASCLAPGDTLYVREGTYDESIYCGITANGCIPSGTSWLTPVTVSAHPGETVTIRPSSPVLRVFNFEPGQQFISIEGFRIDHLNANYAAIQVNGASHIRIKSNDIFGGPGHGINTAQTPEGDHLILGNRIHDSGHRPFDPALPGAGQNYGIYLGSGNSLIEDNEIFNVGGYGIHQYSVNAGKNDNIIRRNIFHDCGLGYDFAGCILIGSGDNNQAYNNVVYHTSRAIMVGYGGSTNGKVLNNTIYDVGVGVTIVSGSGHQVINNIIANGTPVEIIAGSASFAANLCTSMSPQCAISEDPKFVNPAGANFELLSSSRAIDGGQDLAGAGVVTDLLNVARPQGAAFDIGAYEFIASADASPPLVSIISPAEGTVVPRTLIL